MAKQRLWRLALCLGLLIALPPGLLRAGSGPVGWTKYSGNPVMGPGSAGAWNDGEVSDPVVLLDGSTYRMWYSGSRGSFPYRIGYATSPDGKTWAPGAAAVLTEGAPGSWEASGVRGPAVIKDGATYKMWYTGRADDGTSRIGYAESSNGISWTKHGAPVVDLGPSGAWDSRRTGEAAVIKDGGTYKMWYVGVSTGWVWGIGYATSTDGVTWYKHAGNPVLTGSPPPAWDAVVYGPSVILDDGVYRMLYSGGNLSGTAYESGYATSSDGIHWTKQGRVLQQGPDGAFDRYSADYPALLRVGNAYDAWYSGWSDTYRIGLAIAPWINLAYTAHLPLVLRNATACNPVWSDNFSDYRSGWPIGDDADVTLDYTDGEYRLLLKPADAYWWVTPGVQMADGMIEVSVRFAAAGGEFDNGGIVFGQGMDEPENFYRFVIVRNGDYCIQRHDAGVGWVDLECGAATGYAPYPGTNRLTVIRAGEQITALLNGLEMATVSDGAFTGAGRVGLVVGTDAGNADLRFDDYAVYPLQCSDLIH